MRDEFSTEMWDRADEVMKLAMAQSPYAFLLMPQDLASDPWLTGHILGEQRCPKHPLARKLDRVMFGAAGPTQFVVLAHDCEVCGDLLPVHMPWVNPPVPAHSHDELRTPTGNRSQRRARRRGHR